MTDTAAGWIEGDLAHDFPDLALHARACMAPGKREIRAAKQRLKLLSDRLGGRRAAMLRTEAVPSAYRQFLRQIGLDPDQDRTPLERLVLERMLRGEFWSYGGHRDACACATLETGVPVWALDYDAVALPLGIRTADELEPVYPGRLAVVDATGPVAELFGDPLGRVAPHPFTQALLLYAVRVAGVPQGVVEEALWTAANLLDSQAGR